MGSPVVLVSKVPDAFSRPQDEETYDFMSPSVMVTGGQVKVGELKQSQAEFRKHHKEVGDALLNLSEGKDTEDPRPDYNFQQYPQMIYHADGDEKIVHSDSEKKEYLNKGFRVQPYMKPQVAVLDPATEKKALMDQNRQLRQDLTVQGEMMAKMLERMEAMEEHRNAFKK